MRGKIIGIFVVGILLLTGFASIPSQAGPALQPLTSADPQIIEMIQQVNKSLLYYYDNHLTAFGPHYTGSEASLKVSQYIYNEFQSMGLSVEFHNWTLNDFTDRNVVATLPGTDPSSNATYVICAHHDTHHKSRDEGPLGPGAEDDGSGVAAVLMIAKILSQYSFNYTMRFITFSGEEEGLYGSYMYARDAYQRRDDIVAVINVDEIGFANTTEGGRTLWFWVPEQSLWIGSFIRTVSVLYGNQINMTSFVVPVNTIGGVDCQSFIDYGFDAIDARDFDIPPWYHTQNDTLNHVNWTYLTKATKFLLAVFTELASTPIKLQVIITKPYEGYFYFFNHPLFPLVFKNLYLRLLGFRGITISLGTLNVSADVIPYNDINYVYLCFDGNFHDEQMEASPHYQWTISVFDLLFGKYSMEIYACDTSGNVASDEINIILY
jgi:hypothetical protein